jgi:hypothetical protein
MRFVAGKFRYPLAADRLELVAFWDANPRTNPLANSYSVMQIPADYMLRLHEAGEREEKSSVVAFPQYIALINRELWLWPIPGRTLYAHVRYSTIHER